MRNYPSLTVLVAIVSGLSLTSPAHSAIVFSHAVTSLENANTIGSNAVSNPEGSDRDVTAFDHFTLSKSVAIKSVSWRGTSSDRGLDGFTIKIYLSNNNPAAQADSTHPLAVINVAGTANEKPVGKNLSDFSADFDEPLPLTAGVKYWISIVSNRKGVSGWGWANGIGGDGKSIQSFSELRVLPAQGNRAFSFDDGH